jgi:recombination associated protein RdgC
MWFKNLYLYRLPRNWATDSAQLEEQLARLTLHGCSATDARSIGWVAPRAGGSLVHVVNQQWLLALGIEEKLLPASIVKRFASDKAKEIEEAEGRRIGRREMREMVEEMTLELLPRAFVRSRSTYGWIDPINGWLVIDSASPAKAEEFLEHLQKSLGGLPAKVLKVCQSPSAAMTGWVAGGEAPSAFTLDQDLELRSTEKATVRYAKHSAAEEGAAADTHRRTASPAGARGSAAASCSLHVVGAELFHRVIAVTIALDCQPLAATFDDHVDPVIAHLPLRPGSRGNRHS